jgi:RNA polymerase sigma factor (sigma-70 family)
MIPDLLLPVTRASLLGRLRDPGDGVSWELFVRTYGPAMYHFCRRRGVQDSDAVDLVQEVLTQVVTSIRSFEYDPNRGRFRDWLGAIVRSKLSRHWRTRARSELASPTYDPDKLYNQGLDAEWTNELEAHLLNVALATIQGAFTPSNWRAFELTWMHDRPANEVATMLDLPIVQVYVAKSRIAKRLADELKLLSDDTPWLAGHS